MNYLIVRFYGRLADVFGAMVRTPVDPDGCSIEELRRVLAERPEGAGSDVGSQLVRAAVDGALVDDVHRLLPGANVEFFAPLSGG